MGSGGGWWCCCKGAGCIIFYDAFDRYEELVPTETIGGSWQSKAERTGSWWLNESSRPKSILTYDGALYELSGSGEIWCKRSSPYPEQGYRVSIQTIDEIVHSVYRILLCLDPDTGDCLIADFFVGDWTISEASTVSLSKRTGGVVSALLGTDGLPAVKSFVLGANDHNAQYGRNFWANYEGTGSKGVFCAGVTDAQVGVNTQATAEADGPGEKSGLANASGNDIPIEVDDFTFSRLWIPGHEHKFGIDAAPCFFCICKCMDIDEQGVLQHSSVFPYKLNLRMQGVCCDDIGLYTEPPNPCPNMPEDCIDPVDIDVVLEWQESYTIPQGFGYGVPAWYNREPATICGHEFLFVAICGAAGSPSLGSAVNLLIFWRDVGSEDWVHWDLPLPLLAYKELVTDPMQQYTTHQVSGSFGCEPLTVIYVLHIGVSDPAAAFPCCIACPVFPYHTAMGTYTFTITEYVEPPL